MALNFANLNTDFANTNSNKTEAPTMNAFEIARQRAEQAKANSQQQQQAPKEERAPVKYWMNIGKNVTYTETNEDGTVEQKEVFVSLEVPIAVEEIKVKDTKSNNVFQQALKMAKEELLASVLEFAYAIPEGEARVVNGLEVQIRHAGNNSAVVTSAKDHPLLKALHNS